MAKILVMTSFEKGEYPHLVKKSVKFDRLLKQVNVLDASFLKGINKWSDGVVLNLSWPKIKSLVKDSSMSLDNKAWNLVYSTALGELWLTYEDVAKFYCKLPEGFIHLVNVEEEY